MPQHHFVPRTYLKGFAIENTRRVYFYDRRIADMGASKRLIDDVCSQNNLYRVLMDDGTLKDDIEEAFANIAEPTFSEIVQKLVGGRELSYQDKSEFSAYIALQIMRIPASREIYNAVMTEFNERRTKAEWGRLLDDSERDRVAKRMMSESGVDISSLTKEHIRGIIDGTLFKTEWTIPKENWIKHTMESVALTFRAFEGMHWKIYFAPKGTAFITSDNPVGVLVPTAEGWSVGTGFLVKGAVRVFPLTKNACLTIVDDRPDGFSFERATKRRVQQLNMVTAVSHHNILISHSQELLLRCLQRVPKNFNFTELVKSYHVNQMSVGAYD